MSSALKRKLKILGIISIILIVLLINIFIIRSFRKSELDAIRLSNLAVIQSAMNQLYTQTGSFKLSDNCKVGSLLKDPQCSQALLKYINIPNVLDDPTKPNLLCTADVCNKKPCSYSIGINFEDKKYKIYFHLEKGIGNLKKGCHYLDQEGIH